MFYDGDKAYPSYPRGGVRELTRRPRGEVVRSAVLQAKGGDAGKALNTDGTDTGRHAAFLSERVAADHRHDCCRAEKQGTASPARSPAGELLYWHLPGVVDGASH